MYLGLFNPQLPLTQKMVNIYETKCIRQSRNHPLNADHLKKIHSNNFVMCKTRTVLGIIFTGKHVCNQRHPNKIGDIAT